MKRRIKFWLWIIVGAQSAMFGFCPYCNSSAPRQQDCPVCKSDRSGPLYGKGYWPKFIHQLWIDVDPKIRVNYAAVAETAEVLYRKINPGTRMDVPSFFIENLEPYYKAWINSGSKSTFLIYCERLMLKSEQSDG